MEEKYKIVKFNNDLNRLIFNNFNLFDYKVFFTACSYLMEKGDEKIEIDFSILKEYLKYTGKNTVTDKYLIDKLEDTKDKVFKINFGKSKYFRDNGSKFFIDFYPPSLESIKNGTERKILYVRLHDKALYFLNKLAREFTIANLYTLNSIESKYSYRLYLLLKQFQNLEDEKKIELNKKLYSWRNFKIEDFREFMEIPVKYKMSDINKRVLEPSTNELAKYFKEYTYEKIKKGREITNIIFYFIPNEEDVSLEKLKFKVNPNITEIDEYFNNTFINVTYTNILKETLNSLVEEFGLEYTKNYLDELWENCLTNKKIKGISAYFSKLIISKQRPITETRKKELKELENKKIEENNRNTKGITSLKEFVKDITDYKVRKNITPEQIEQQVLLKADITEEEYNKIKQDWIDKEKETNPFPLRTLEKLFDMKNKEKYNIIPAEEEETKLNLKYTKEVYEGKIKKTEYQIEFYKKELFKIMEDDDLELEELEEKRKYIENKIESYKIKIENYKKEILKLKEEKN